MTYSAKTHYDYSRAREEIAKLGLIVDEQALESADYWLWHFKLQEVHANDCIILHAKHMAKVLNRENLSWKNRIMFALYYLGLTPNPLKGK